MEDIVNFDLDASGCPTVTYHDLISLPQFNSPEVLNLLTESNSSKDSCVPCDAARSELSLSDNSIDAEYLVRELKRLAPGIFKKLNDPAAISNAIEWMEIDENGSEWMGIDENGSEWLGMDENGSECLNEVFSLWLNSFLDENDLQDGNNNQEECTSTQVEEVPMPENNVTDQSVNERSVMENACIGEPAENNQLRFVGPTPQFSYGATEIEQQPSYRKKPTKAVKSSDISSTFCFVDSGAPIKLYGVTMEILNPPCPLQRARYERDFLKETKYIFITGDKTFTIKIPDLRSCFPAGTSIWLRVTRTTQPHENSGIVVLHPYPIWINNENAVNHCGSLMIPITAQDMENGTITIKNFAMTRLLQGQVAKLKTLSIYSPAEMTPTNTHPTGAKNAKDCIKIYQLKKSILKLQLVAVDENKVAYCTNVTCSTDPIEEYEASDMEGLRSVLDSYGVSERQRSRYKKKKIGELKKSQLAAPKKKRTMTKHRNML